MSNSIIDYVFRALGLEYLNRTDIVQVPPKESQLLKAIECECKVDQCSCFDRPLTPIKESKAVTPIKESKAETTTKQVSNSVDTVQEVLSDMMGDAPACDDCGHITVRNGSCYKCLNCGNSLGCS